MTRTIRVLTGAVLMALAPLAPAQTTGDVDTQVTVVDTTAANRGQTHVATRIASSFTNLAGSEENALALVRALRNGTAVTFTTTPDGTGTGTTTDVTFTPPTGKMGWGNVKIALALAQDSLARAGITNPTPEQLQAALMGGDVTVDGTTTSLRGILQMRADGMGWGKIAQSSGTKLGPVVSGLRKTNAQLSRLPAAGTGDTTTTTASTTTSTQPPKRGLTTASGDATTTKVKGPSKGVTTAAGTDVATSKLKGPSKGVTTAAGTDVATRGNSGKGFTSAGGSAGQAPRGISTATGATSGNAASSRGLVTAGGAISGASPRGNAYGHGIVSGAGGGGGATSGVTASRGHGAGVVTATGSGAGSVSTAASGGNGRGNAGGNGKGNGKGGG